MKRLWHWAWPWAGVRRLPERTALVIATTPPEDRQARLREAEEVRRLMAALDREMAAWRRPPKETDDA